MNPNHYTLITPTSPSMRTVGGSSSDPRSDAAL